ncbi:hypothetical protein CLV82_1783 [Zeaxanthinibacter enoshimensis]|uniref:Uncharacterized protein n=2 Tax=Zeaxanthinibacter enoshimensis TaxID=392009 RepID=A0A4R6TKS9_9FLAO|nr:hypothetical protein CLV82_1783 [Zeaxanthinibacter enoshimensis]
MLETRNNILLLFLTILFLGSACRYKEESTTAVRVQAKLLTQELEFTAGDKVEQVFAVSPGIQPFLMVDGSLGISVLNSRLIGDQYFFLWSDHLSEKSGSFQWKLLAGGDVVLSGKVEITPATPNTGILETYLGPKRIFSGEEYKSMLVSIPTDKFDNPIAPGQSTEVHMRSTDGISTIPSVQEDLIVWTPIPGSNQAQQLKLAAVLPGSRSREQTLEVSPSVPMPFPVLSDTSRGFADGKELLQIRTGMVRDRYGNILADGTLVRFQVENSSGFKLFTEGKLINGMASAAMLHPTSPGSWKIEAVVGGVLSSEPLMVSFEMAVTGYNLRQDQDIPGKLYVEQVSGVMGQMIQDGFPVSISLKDPEFQLLLEKNMELEDGGLTVDLGSEKLSPGKYLLAVNIGGFKRTMEIVL